jgi:alanine racemase
LNADRSGSAGPVLTIDLGALARNWTRLAAHVAPAECAAVVKADAYGIGTTEAVVALRAAGCRTFFVAFPEEGARVRTAAPDGVIYVLSGFQGDLKQAFHAHDLRPVLNTLSCVESWARHASGRPSALHVDTGMNRLGLSLREAVALARRHDLYAAAAPQLLISHLACADDPDDPMNAAQVALFREIRGEFPALPASLANSAGMDLGPDFAFDMVRAGIALYGVRPSDRGTAPETVVTLEARVLQVRSAAAGETVGYGAMRRLAADTTIAILAAGYADGYPRAAGSSDTHAGASVHIRQRTAPILGRISMDQIAVDVTGIAGVGEGDWAELFGPHVAVDEVAAAAGTIAYEILTHAGRRGERIYVGRPGSA